MIAVNLLAMHYDEMGQRAADGGAKEFAKALGTHRGGHLDGCVVRRAAFEQGEFLAHAGRPSRRRGRRAQERRASSISLIVS